MELEDADGCIQNISFTINAVDGLDITSTPTPTICNLDNGSVAFTINQGTAPVTYTDNGTPVTEFIDLAAGNYVWDAEDANGCTFQVSFTIDDSDPLTITTNAIPTTCGLDNGEILLFYSPNDAFNLSFTTQDGNPVPADNIGSGASTLIGKFYNIIGISAGTHTWTATNTPDGCEVDFTFTIGASDPLLITPDPIATTCNMDNGSVSFTTITGTDPVAYTENGQPVTMTGLAAGSYTWDAEDATGCTGQVSFTIDNSDVLDVTPTITHTTCNLNNGEVSMTINTGTEPVIYRYNGFAIILDSPVWPPGTYTIDAEDANGCMTSFDLTIDPSNVLDITPTPTATTCGENNGSVSFTVNTGDGPISYTENGVPVTDFTGLAAGSYTWDAEDTNGCLLAVQFTIDGSIMAELSTTPTHTFCDGNNGSVQGAMTSGTGFLTYTLNGQVNTTGFYDNLAPGTYTMTAVDALFCPSSSTFIIEGSDPLEISTVIEHTFCNEDNGSITATLDSGTSPVSYTIAGEGTNTTGLFMDLAPGTYTLDATDAVGCDATETFTIDPSVSLTISTDVTPTTCGLDNGTISATLLSGTAPVQFTLNGNLAFMPTSNLPSGSYLVEATDANGCQASTTVEVSESNVMAFELSSIHTSCNEDNGSINATVLTSNGDVIYRINGMVVHMPLTGLEPGTYTVFAIDDGGCYSIESVSIESSDALIFEGMTTTPTCGDDNGALDINILSNNGEVDFTVNGSPVTFPMNNLESGDYVIEGTDEDGCTYVHTVEIEKSFPLNFYTYIKATVCGYDNGTIELVPINPIGDVSVTIDGVTTNSLIRHDLAPGNYWINVVSEDGCDWLGYAIIEESLAMTFDVTVTPSQECGDGFGNVSVSNNNNTNLVWYSIEGYGNSFDGDFACLPVGMHTIVANDYQGCTASETFNINNMVTITTTIETQDATCSHNADGTASVLANGGEGPYEYYWNELDLTGSSQENLYPGFYTVDITDVNGSTTSVNVEVEYNDTIAPYLTKFTFVAAITPNPSQQFTVENDIIPFVVENCALESVTIDMPDLTTPGEYKRTIVMTDVNQNVHTVNVYFIVAYIVDGTQGLDASNQNPQLLQEDKSIKVSSLTVYPNPTNSNITIENQDLNNQNVSIEFFDVAGNIVQRENTHFSAGKTRLTVQSLDPGVYIIRIIHKDMIYTERLVKFN